MKKENDINKNMIDSNASNDLSYKYNWDSGVTYNAILDFLRKVYNMLEIDKFFDSVSTKAKYNPSSLFMYNTILRISKKRNKQSLFELQKLFGDTSESFKTHDIYRAFDLFDDVSVDLKKYIDEKVSTIIGTKSSSLNKTIFTLDDAISVLKISDINYDFEDTLNNEIVQTVLYTNSEGDPLHLSVHKGLEISKEKLLKTIDEIKKAYNIDEVICVGDSKLIDFEKDCYIPNNEYRYIASRIIEFEKAQKYEKTFHSEYNKIDDTFMYKLVNADREQNIGGQIVNIKENVLVFWDYYQNLIDCRKRLNIVKKFLNKLQEKKCFDSELLKQYRKVTRESEYDGYSIIVTSEKELTFEEIVRRYAVFLHLKEELRLTQKYLKGNPLFISNKNRLNGAFVYYYTSLMILKIIYYKVNKEIPLDRIVNAIRLCNFYDDNGMYYIKYKGEKYKYDEKHKNEVKEDLCFNDFLKILEIVNIRLPI